GPDVFATGGKTLKSSQQEQQNRRPPANGGIGRQKSQDERTCGHQQHGGSQHAPPTDTITHETPEQTAQGANHERYGKADERGQCCKRRAWKEILGNIYDNVTVNAEVIPFREVADGGSDCRLPHVGGIGNNDFIPLPFPLGTAGGGRIGNMTCPLHKLLPLLSCPNQVSYSVCVVASPLVIQYPSSPAQELILRSIHQFDLIIISYNIIILVNLIIYFQFIIS